VNSGGVVFFALFSSPGNCGVTEAAAVIKFSSSKMATQAERLGYEFARLLGVHTPQVFPNPQLILYNLIMYGAMISYTAFVTNAG
jgi:hypothetical protein